MNTKKLEYITKQGRNESRRVLWTKLFMGKKSSTRLQYHCLSQGNNTRNNEKKLLEQIIFFA